MARQPDHSNAMRPESVYPARDRLGEGPVWNVEEQALYWVDIVAGKLQRWQPESRAYASWLLPSEIGCFAFRARGGLVVALRTGLALFDPASGKLEPLVDPEADRPNNRFNDGKCDRSGRFWVGTLNEENRPEGALYCLDAAGHCTRVRPDVTIANGLGWSPDNRTMYFTDSAAQTIFAYDFDAARGTLADERVFARLDDGFPDGLTVDRDGCVWSAIWDGWRIARFAPDGSLVEEIAMPVQRPTSCTFGGTDLRDLYITTASIELSDEAVARQPLAGHLFRITTNAQGIPEPSFAG